MRTTSVNDESSTESPEYLTLFSGEGPVEIFIKFKNLDGFTRQQRMYPEEIHKLISSETGLFFRQLHIDEWLFDVYKYEIDPIKNQLTIRVRPSGVPPHSA